MSTYSITTSGPSPQSAMLRALVLKATHTVTAAALTIRVTLQRLAHLAKGIAGTALAVIGSRAGYDLATNTVKKIVTTGWGLLKKAASWFGRLVRKAGNAITKGIALISPSAAAWVAEATTRWIVRPVSTFTTTVASWVALAGHVLWELSHTTLFRAATVLGAQVASLVLAIHAISRGAVASRIVSAVPALFDVVLTITNPAKVVAIVAGVFVAACAVAFVRLLTNDGPESPVPAAASPVTPLQPSNVATPPAPAVDLMAVAAKLSVDVAPDGSVTVHGIPADLPEEVARRVAEIASDAAVKQLRRILSARSTPSRDDRRLLNKVAKEAVRAEGQRATA